MGVRSSEASRLAGARLPTLALTGLDLGAAEALLAQLGIASRSELGEAFARAELT